MSSISRTSGSRKRHSNDKDTNTKRLSKENGFVQNHSFEDLTVASRKLVFAHQAL